MDKIKFDWQEFCDEYGIEYNIHSQRGWLDIHCPFCGEDDSGRHMGVRTDVESPGWNCWRNHDHRGRNPLALVQALLKCKKLMALQIIHSQSPYNYIEKKTPEVIKPDHDVTLSIPEEFHPIRQEGYAGKFSDYLLARGFPDWQDVAFTYDLRYCLVGEFKWRLIFPIFTSEEGLVSWTGRTIRKHMEPPYLSLSDAPIRFSQGKLMARHNVKDVIYNQDKLALGGRVLVITEGPFDALKLDHYGKTLGVRAGCLFGKTVSASKRQLLILSRLVKHFERVEVCLDQDARAEAWRLVEMLTVIGKVHLHYLPNGVKDPGELTKDQINKMFS